MKRVLMLIAFACVLWPLPAAAIEPDSNPQPELHPFSGDPKVKKSIFVFLDGTRNQFGDATNVSALFHALQRLNDPQFTAQYFRGVGVGSTIEAALGKSMQARILAAYDFVADSYARGDEVFIFGFSRGAFEARALAGLLSYAGVPMTRGSTRCTSEPVLEVVKELLDEEYDARWQRWAHADPPPVAEELKRQHVCDSMQPVTIAFLGLWDVVPGSSLKNFDVCKEKRGFIKRMFWRIPGVTYGQRYKVDSYPPIRVAAHAVARDEKRSTFQPLLLCPPIQPAATMTHEMWFPGAHSDVGGGYDDVGLPRDLHASLPNASLNWMISLLRDQYPRAAEVVPYPEDAFSLAHWSIGDSPGNVGADCEDRSIPSDALAHPSVAARLDRGTACIRLAGGDVQAPYPDTCDLKNRQTSLSRCESGITSTSTSK